MIKLVQKGRHLSLNLSCSRKFVQTNEFLVNSLLVICKFVKEIYGTKMCYMTDTVLCREILLSVWKHFKPGDLFVLLSF